jgi:branched-chain amino acid transport system substrate-binding protein
MKFRNFLALVGAAAISFALAEGASAEDKVVKIGAVFPMSGADASIGIHARAAFDVITDIVNNAHPELPDLPLAKNAGLAGLGGAKVQIDFADNQGSPSTGQNQTLRLITEDKVVALTGAYQSGITSTSSAIAERYGIPYVNAESIDPKLTERGFQWFFRTTPLATDFARVFADFLTDMKGQGARTDNIALVHDNTEYATAVDNTITTTFKEKGLNVGMDIVYTVNTADVQGQVAQLKDKKPDVVIMISYTPDAILFARTMQAQDYKPPLLLANDAGYSDPAFVTAVGNISQGVFNRSSWTIGPPGSNSAVIADMYKKKSGIDMDDTVAREMQGLLVLLDAIDRAGSTEPGKIQAALKATDLKPDQLLVGYNGVKFDDKGQNILASGGIIQLQDGENYVSVWPKTSASKPPILPYKGW